MRAYRHWDAQWAREFQEFGRIRIQPLSYYKEQFHQPGIQDERENTRHVIQRGAIGSSGRLIDRDRAALANLGIHLGSAQNVIAFGNQSFSSGETVYVVCLTALSERGVFTYDTITPIADVSRFASALFREARGQFRRIAFRRVSYAAAPHFAEDGPVPAPDPFSKYPEFAHQEEIRIALWPAEPINGPIYLESPTLYQSTLRR